MRWSNTASFLVVQFKVGRWTPHKSDVGQWLNLLKDDFEFEFWTYVSQLMEKQ